MLILFNKAKIISYAVSIFTVVSLFLIANSMFSNEEVMEVKANTLKNENNIINTVIY